jgi:Zn finger protein HypA/HybF involved in hydrogenase expression
MSDKSHARFECDCGNEVVRPRGIEGHPECPECEDMSFREDVEVAFSL